MSAAKVSMTVVKPEGTEPIFKAGDIELIGGNT
jgi:hypothetical protein